MLNAESSCLESLLQSAVVLLTRIKRAMTSFLYPGCDLRYGIKASSSGVEL
jgi:hypothetical protein